MGPGASFIVKADKLLDRLVFRLQDKHIDLKRVQEAITAPAG